MLHDNDESNLFALLERQLKASQDINTVNVSSLPTGSAVAVQIEDGRPRMHEMIIRYGTDNHNGRGYRVRVNKTGYEITRMKTHVKPTNMSAEHYLQNEMPKPIRHWQQTD